MSTELSIDELSIDHPLTRMTSMLNVCDHEPEGRISELVETLWHILRVFKWLYYWLNKAEILPSQLSGSARIFFSFCGSSTIQFGIYSAKKVIEFVHRRCRKRSILESINNNLFDNPAAFQEICK